MNTMEYQGFQAIIEYDGKDGIFVGRIAGIRVTVGFHGATVAELETAFHNAVDDYLQRCDERGVSPQQPFSGKVMLRIPPEIHAKTAMRAEANGKSLNQYVTDVLTHI